MNILLLGAGAREHALAWKLNQSAALEKLYVAPGNAGTATVATNVAIRPTDFEAIRAFVVRHSVDLVVVGPEEPLVRGVYDFFRADPELQHIPLIGPSQAGAQLEGSKDFAKQFMLRHQIPTARYFSVTNANRSEGIDFMRTLHPPYVLKADGLAAGKGVRIVEDWDSAVQALDDMLGGEFGRASETVVIEEFLSGIECSFFVLTDGTHYRILPEAKDYKRIGEHDTGLNTGGMGAVSPVSFVDASFREQVERQIIAPTIEGLKQEGIVYKGFIFFGLINVAGRPYLIEYNCRLGDPETQVVMLRLSCDLPQVLLSVAEGRLHQAEIAIDERAAAAVVLASGGYPQEYRTGFAIRGLERTPDSLVFHAGTCRAGDSTLTAGGRVLTVSSYGETMEEALRRSYASVACVDFEGKCFRKDIGFDV
jgi:phosphoribosylamine--glycine ligase